MSSSNSNIPFHVFFSTFDIDKLGKICQHHCDTTTKISNFALFESDLLKTNKDMAPQCHKIIQMFCRAGGTNLTPKMYHLQIWQFYQF